MIDIIVPGSHTDQRWTRLISRRKYNELLREGTRIYEDMSARLTRDFRHDLKSCEEVTLDTWRQRPLFEKIIEPFAWIFERQQ
jgi:phosphatidylserine/phosphatidylglycerophosphate/cardiolipin synthase-like enzyme